MQKGVVRVTLLVLLLATGTGAGLTAWNIDRQARALDDAREDVAGQLDRLRTANNEIAAAQHAYVAPGQPVEAAAEQVATLIQRIYSDSQAIRPKLRSVEAAELLQVLTDATASLAEADNSARGYLQTGQSLWTSEVVFGQAHDVLATMTQSVRALQAAEARAAGTEQAVLAQQRWSVIGGAALMWTIGLIALARVPRANVASVPVTPVTLPSDVAPPEEREDAATPETPSVDLTAAADVCTAISRLTSADQLPALLTRIATVIDASGIILWMGAGEELLAAAAHGYDPRVIGRLGAIPRSADNATAAAWRTGQVGFVPGDVMSNGAIVAPLFGQENCIGVLAAEVRHGRETDAATRAVTAMIAAQLSTALSAWPAPSTAPASAPDAAPLREASGL